MVMKHYNPDFKRYIIDRYITPKIYKNSEFESRYELMKIAMESFKQEMVNHHGSRRNWELAVAKKHGCNSIYEYTLERIKMNGFKDILEYMQYLAEKSGFKTTWDRQKHYIIKKYGSLKNERKEFAKRNGFKGYKEYQDYIYIKRGFKNRSEYQKELNIKNYGSQKERSEVLAKKAGFKTYSDRRKQSRKLKSLKGLSRKEFDKLSFDERAKILIDKRLNRYASEQGVAP